MLQFKPLVIVSYPRKHVRRLRISPYTLSQIDREVFKDGKYTMFKSGKKEFEIGGGDRELICRFLCIDVKECYDDVLYIDGGCCSFSVF